MSLDDLTNKATGIPTVKGKRSFAWLLPLALLLGFFAVFGLLFGKRLLPAVEVEVAPVITIRSDEAVLEESEIAPGKGALLFQASGWVEPDPYTVYVSTLINGVVKEVHALEGQVVKKGELLATLVDDDARLDLEERVQKYASFKKRITAHCSGFDVISAETSAVQRKIEALETQVDEARDTSTRLGKLSKGTVSQQQVVQARLATERQIAVLAEARAEIPRLEALRVQLKSEELAMIATLDELATAQARAELSLERTQIRATMDGVVLRLHASPGMKRMLDMDSPTSAVIVELYNPKKLQARIDVPLNEAATLSAGQEVELVSDLLPNKTFLGTVTRISGQADLQRNTLQAKVEIQEPDERLRPDMLVRAKFFAPKNHQSTGEASVAQPGRLSLYVPEEALAGEMQVWVVSPDSTAERREIQLGENTKDGHRLVLKGLRSGESVILPPHENLEEGGRVDIFKTAQ